MGKNPKRIPPQKLELFEKLIATHPKAVRKGASMPYTSLNGHMFSFIKPNGKVALRLNAEDRQAFIAKYKSKLAESHGTVMKEYVEIPDSLLKKTQALKVIFKASFDYVSSLKPKPTTRKSTKKKVSKKKTSKKKVAKKRVRK